MKNYKNSMQKLVIGSLLVCCMTTHKIYAIHEAGFAFNGTTAGAYDRGVGANVAIGATLIALLVAGVSWSFVHALLVEQTPQEKIDAARKIIRWVEADSLVTNDFFTYGDFERHCSNRFGTSWALVLAHAHTRKLANDLDEVLQLIKQIRRDCSAGDCLWVSTECNKLERRVAFLAAVLEARMNLINPNSNYQYLDQVRLYKARQERELILETQRMDIQRLRDSLERQFDRTERARENQNQLLNAELQREHETALKNKKYEYKAWKHILHSEEKEKQREFEKHEAKHERHHEKREAERQREYDRAEKKAERKLKKRALEAANFYGDPINVNVAI